MDFIDQKIKDVLSTEIHEHQNYNKAIKTALYSKENKIAKKLKYMKMASAFCAGTILSTGIVLAAYTSYEKIWMNPQRYMSLEEKLNADLEEIEENKENINKDNIIDKKQIVMKIKNIIDKLEVENIAVEEKDVQEVAEKFDYYYLVENNNISFVFSANGELQNFVNRNNESNIIEDKISIEDAQKVADKIIESIDQNDKYILNSINETESDSEIKSQKKWYAEYYRTYNGLKDEYDRISLYFYSINNKINIESIITYNSNFSYNNNELIISEEEAKEIAYNIDRQISILDIKSIESELSIKAMNSYIYAQLNSLGKDDQNATEIQTDEKKEIHHIYTEYENEKKLRNVYNIKIRYIIDYEKRRNISEFSGRNYYIDATTGECIGGSWGDEIY